MFDVIKHNVPDDLASSFTLKSGSRPSRRGRQFVIQIGKQSIQHRGPTIWTFLNRLININETISKDKFKQILRRFFKDINNFSFRAPMIANKHNDYVYSRLPITRTFKGNRKKFELSGVRVIGSSKKIAESKVKNSFYCTVNILITFNCRNVK